MLKIFLFSLLVIVAVCLDEYSVFESPDKEFRYFLYSDPLPPLIDPKGPLSFNFFANRMGDTGLAFTLLDEDSIHFGFEEEEKVEEEEELIEHFTLVFVKFEFPDGDHRRVKLKFKSLSTEKEFTVTSRVFKPPKEDSSKLHAAECAVSANTMDLTVATSLRDAGYPFNRPILLNIDWVVELLQKRRPMLYHTAEPDHWKTFYIGLPLILDAKVLEILDEVRRNMHFPLESEDHNVPQEYDGSDLLW